MMFESSGSSQLSQIMFRRSGRSYGNATQTFANDPDRFKIYNRPDRLDRTQFYASNRGRLSRLLQNLHNRPNRLDRTQFYASNRGRLSRPGHLVAFPYDRPYHLSIFLRRLG